jgi:hypothetical protein
MAVSISPSGATELLLLTLYSIQDDSPPDLIPSPPNEHAASIFQWLLALIAVRAFVRAKGRDCAHQSGIVPYFTHLLEFLFAWDDEWWGCKGFNHPAVWFAAPNSSIFDRPWV